MRFSQRSRELAEKLKAKALKNLGRREPKTADFFNRYCRLSLLIDKGELHPPTFDALLQQGIEIADERARLAKRGAAAHAK